MKFIKVIKIDKKLNDKINFYLNHNPISEDDEYLHEDETIRETAVFSDGTQMDIKCCGVHYDEGAINTAWTEAVLFKMKGSVAEEVACSEVCDNFTGAWELDDRKGNTYVAIVEVA